MHGSNHRGLGGIPPRLARRSRIRRTGSWLAAVACVTLGAGLVGQAAGAAAAGAASAGPDLAAMPTVVAADPALWPALAAPSARPQLRAPSARPRATLSPNCTFNGATGIVENVTPGSLISVICSGWPANDTIAAAEFSPLLATTGSTDDIDQNDAQIYTSDPSGNLVGTFVVPNPFSAPDPAAVCPPSPAQAAQGYLRCGVALADANNNGTAVALSYAGQLVPPPAPGATAVGMAATPDGGGYWLAWSDGDVTTHGDAPSYGNASTLALTQPITHIVATPDGGGYWLVAADGGTFAFGTAGFYGSMGGIPLNKPVVDMAPTSDGKGYWLVASDGGIFAFGDAVFRGSMGGRPLNKPVVGIAADTATGGYWLVASDGGIFAIGAPFFGSTGALSLNQPVNGMAVTPTNKGYLFVASDGGIFAFGDAAFHGSTGSLTLNKPIVGLSIDPATGGYWLVGSDGGIFAFGAPFFGAG
ncbi:MAG TPA: hypothetical protein VG205_12435 [Acidimicrobiales bacterium]|nr:hypothetical protein [Acidimicrobiales bacterium]